MRAVRAAQLLERGFANNTLSWLRPSLGTVDNLVPIDASPPNLRDEMCGGKRKRPASDEDEDTTVASNASGSSSGETAITFFTAGLQPPMAKPSELLAGGPAASEPMVGLHRPEENRLRADRRRRRGRSKSRRRGRGKRVAGCGQKAGCRGGAEEPKPNPGRPAAVRHANAKPDAAPKAAEKPVATAKPAKPKAAAKPAPKSSEARPADQKTAAAPRT